MKPTSDHIMGCLGIGNTVSSSPVASLMRYATSLSWSSPWASVVPMSYVLSVILNNGRTRAISGATLLA